MGTREIDLDNTPVKITFWKYTLSSIAIVLIVSIYYIADGIIVGRGIGSTALAAVNLSVPVMLFVNYFTFALAIGGSIIISVRLSRKEYDKANNVFSLLFWMNLTIALGLVVLVLLSINKLPYFLGANEETFLSVKRYLSVLILFAPFFTLEATLSSAIRNDGNPVLAFISLAISSLINIPLDYVVVFILGWGLTGAALATGFSQLVSVIILSAHFIFKKGNLRFVKPKFDAPLLKQKIKNSLSVYISGIFFPAVMFITNILAKRHYGTLGVSACAIVSGISMFIIIIFTGIAQGIQPPISYYLGLKNKNNIKETLRLGLTYSTLIGSIIIGVVVIFPEMFIGFYIKENGELLNLTVKALRIFLSGFLFMGTNLIFISYFQSIQKNREALSISIMRTFVSLILVAIILPLIFGQTAIWFIVPVSETLIFIGTIIFFSKTLKNKTLEKKL